MVVGYQWPVWWLVVADNDRLVISPSSWQSGSSPWSVASAVNRSPPPPPPPPVLTPATLLGRSHSLNLHLTKSLEQYLYNKAGRNFRLKSEIFSVLLSGPVPLLLTVCLWCYSSRVSEFNMSIMTKIKLCLAILYLFTIVPSLFVDLLESLLRYYFLLLL